MKSKHDLSLVQMCWKAYMLGALLLVLMSVLAISCSEDKPTDSTPKLNPVSWDSGDISLNADDFYIEAAGVKYLAKVANVSVHSSSSTLELEWTEHDSDMRLYIYIESDSANWWSDEIRTYDGAMNDGTRWIYYLGEFFRSARGTQFQGDVDLTSSGSDNGVAGTIHFKNLRLLAL